MTTEATLQTLPGDDVRQIMWRYENRFDLQMLIQSARSVARGTVARIVAEGGRNSHEWTEAKQSMLQAFDDNGLTTAFLDMEFGGYIEGPKNLALALTAFELAWVDAGAATANMAGNLALAPIHEKGTREQKEYYMSRCVPSAPGEERETMRGSFVLTEPLPYVGVDTGVLSGKMKILEWKEGEEPLLQVEKRGRFITNMDYANFVTVAVDSADPRIKGSCMVILEKQDPGTYDRGAPTLKLVHQLSSTRDPIFNLKIPANRIIGGYTIKDDKIIPNFSHADVIESVFKRTRVTVAPMSSAKLVSAIEPIIRYQRTRFRGGSMGVPGKPRFELGLQQKEDALHRLISVWSTGEASASLGFQAARLLDVYDQVEEQKDEIFKEQGLTAPRQQMKEFKKIYEKAISFLQETGKPDDLRSNAKLKELGEDPMVQYVLAECEINVLTPASKLWNTGHGANKMREAVSLMGGYGITEDCPGFLGQKWMDTQLEATYEGPESVQRRQLSVTMTHPVFLEQFSLWIKQIKKIASDTPETGACNLGTAMKLWLWTLKHLQTAKDADGKALYQSKRQGVTFPLADALSAILSARAFLLDVMELQAKGPESPVLAESIEGTLIFFKDLCHVHAAYASGEVGRITAELVHGYNRHPEWNEQSIQNCYQECELQELEGVIPGITGPAEGTGEVIHEGEAHPTKAGPCVKMQGLRPFTKMRIKLDGCLTGACLARDRAARTVTQVMIPEALDYPL